MKRLVEREKCERLLLCWPRETTRDLKSIATGTVGTLAVQLGTWFVNSPDREWNCNTR